ncbi:MAG: PqqD family protein [Bacteroidales bacterium]|nr:PqqD family protein [Bacteroidales bacterium]
MKIKKGFVLREMCGENIVTGEGMEHINFNKLISLNSTAAFLWKKLADKDEFTAEDMAQLLVEEYEIEMELALTDSKNLCQAWIDAGVAE